MRTALIDGDLLLYTHACAFTQAFDWSNDDTPEGIQDVSVSMDIKGAIKKVDAVLAELQEVADCQHLVLCFSCPREDNFRRHLMDSYKHNRGEGKPELYGLLKLHYEGIHECIEGDKIEADDLLGILSGPDKVVCSFDKDLGQISGEHYDWRTQSLYTVEQADADMLFWKQCLMGDPTDGYYGVPYVGKLRAERWLQDVTNEADAWRIIKQAYEKKEISEELALTQCRMARILRPGEYDMENSEVLLWEPPREVHSG